MGTIVTGMYFHYCSGTKKEEAVVRNKIHLLIPCIAVFLVVGCSAGRIARLEESVASQQEYTRELMAIVDRNSPTINETAGQLAAMDQRLSNIEAKLDVSMTDDSATTQEMKESLSFLNDQLARIDKSVQTTRPTDRPQGANVFRPGGYNLNTSYDAALADFNEKKYETAISGFKEVLTVAPSSSLADNAQYWIGECYDAMGNYEQALTALSKVFDYPESNKLPDAHVKSALIYQKLGKTDMARQEFRAVISNYPDTSAANIAAIQLNAPGQ